MRATSADDAWEAALTATRHLLETTKGLGILFGKQSRRLAKHLRRLQGLLEPAQRVADWPAAEVMESWTAAEAFEAGRALQRAGDARDVARKRFVDQWPVVRRKIVALKAAV